jgi:hypothetical protein
VTKHRPFGFVRKLPSGKIQASYLDPSKRRRNAPRTFTTKGDARAWLALMETSIQRGTWEVPSERGTTPLVSTRFEDYCLMHIKMQTSGGGLT